MFGKQKSNLVHTMILDEVKEVETCLIHFESFISVATAPDVSVQTLKPLAEKLDKSEANADVALRRMIDSLATAPLLPSTRQDIIEVATSCDKIANKCEHTAAMIYCQNFLFPEDFKDSLVDIISVTREQFSLLNEAISRLFGDFRSLSKDYSILDDIRKLESRVDDVEIILYHKTFGLQKELAEKTQIARFVELVCDISDIIENIADKIQIMLITRKA